MLNFNNFCEMVEHNIQKHLPDEYKMANVSVNTVMKNNDIKSTGLVILPEGQRAAPTIYLESFYEEYLNGAPVEQVYCNIVDTYKEHIHDVSKEMVEDIVSNLTSSDRIFMKVVNYRDNMEFLADKPFT